MRIMQMAADSPVGCLRMFEAASSHQEVSLQTTISKIHGSYVAPVG